MHCIRSHINNIIWINLQFLVHCITYTCNTSGSWSSGPQCNEPKKILFTIYWPIIKGKEGKGGA